MINLSQEATNQVASLPKNLTNNGSISAYYIKQCNSLIIRIN